MERFELLQTDDDRKEELERLRDVYCQNNMSPLDADIYLSKKISRSFGLDHSFKKLTEEETARIDYLFAKREKLLECYNDSFDSKLYDELKKVNEEICQIEGHRLGENALDNGDYDDVTSLVYFRECLVCGDVLSETAISSEDVVVKRKNRF